MPETSRARLEAALDVSRALVVTERRRLIATLAAYEIELVLPGAVVAPAVALIDLCVLPDARGRGHLRSLITRYLEDAHERAEPLSVLNTEEYELYPRFGFGVASYARTATLSKPERLPPPSDASVAVERLSHLEASATLPELFDVVAKARSGEVTRTDIWWGEYFDEAARHEETTTFCVAVKEGAIDGYSVTQRNPNGAVVITELAALSDAAARVLVDEVISTAAGGDVRFRSVAEDAHLSGLIDSDAVVETGSSVPQSWLRIADVKLAMPLRRYARAGQLDFFVEDATAPWNSACYRLQVGEDGVAAIDTTSAPPTLTLDVGSLASIFAGARSPSVLAEGGCVQQLEAGALSLADELFSTPAAPFCSTLL